MNYPPDLKDRIARVLSEILSDKYDAQITLRFVPKEGACDCTFQPPESRSSLDRMGQPCSHIKRCAR